MVNRTAHFAELDSTARHFYQETLRLLNEKQGPYLVGGAYAFERYTGIERHTKDLDVFVLAKDCLPLLDTLKNAGYHTEMTFPHWLAKAFRQDLYIDLIFGSGNGLCPVDEDWFNFAPPATVLEIPVRLCPPEEMIWSKSFIMERERYDGADVAHLIKACGSSLDWNRLLARYDEDYWPVLLSHLLLFRFIYPGEAHKIPSQVFQTLLSRVQPAVAAADARDCRGTLLSREQYLTDIGEWGYRDVRLAPKGNLSAADVRHWTAAIESH